MKKALLGLYLSAAFFSGNANAASVNYSPQNTLIGATSTVESNAHFGVGITFGIIDTGTTAAWIGFNNGMPNINSIASTCIIAGCQKSLSVNDDNGHGTFVTSEIVGSVAGVNMSGVAPNAKAIAVKVLNAAGSGNSNDVSTGIIYAVNNGAQILNLSLGPSGTAAQQTAFYQSLATAINYAASKNAIIFFAGGNSSQNFANGGNISGFTDAAIQRMIFVGSTNANLALSSFSNKPGATNAGFISTTGKFYAYDTRWVMADGENIWGASNYHTAQNGYSYITQMSGTSMAAPQAAGAAGLLAARWPFLINTGQIPAILLQTGQDLGTKGVDTTFGEGFLRIDTASQPIGQLAIPINGKMTPVNTATLITTGPLGNANSISSALQKAVGYDNYNRDYQIALASSVSAKSSTSSASSSATQVSGQSGAGSRSFTETGEDSWLATSFINAPVITSSSATVQNSMGISADPTRPSQYDWSIGFTQGDRYTGVGQGSGAAVLFNDARWGEKTAFFNSDAAGAGTVLGLVPDAKFTSMGIKTPSGARFSAEVINSNSNGLGNYGGTDVSAQGMALGYTIKPEDSWSLSLTGSLLKENNMLLGSASTGLLNLGNSNTTESIGLGTNFKMGDGYQLGFDTSYMTTSPSSNGASLISNTSRLSGASFNLALSKDNFTGHNDALGITLKKPLRVYSGSAYLNVPTGTDSNGNPIIQKQRVGLAPDGNETDFGLNYARPLAENINTSFNVSYRQDADNIAGENDGAAMFRFNMSF